MQAPNYEELEKLSITELKRLYDRSAVNTTIGLGFLREEISRREAEKINLQLFVFTKQMRNMTVLVLILTIVNVFFAAIPLFR